MSDFPTSVIVWLYQELILVPAEAFMTNLYFMRNMNYVPEDWQFSLKL